VLHAEHRTAPDGPNNAPAQISWTKSLAANPAHFRKQCEAVRTSGGESRQPLLFSWAAVDSIAANLESQCIPAEQANIRRGQRFVTHANGTKDSPITPRLGLSGAALSKGWRC
jgi:hypothetical protein